MVEAVGDTASVDRRSLATRALVRIVVFFFVYSVQFSAIPGGVGTRVWLGVAGFLALLLPFVWHIARVRVPGATAALVIAAAAIGLISMASMSINATADVSFLAYPLSMFVVATAAYPAAVLVRRAYADDPAGALKRIFVEAVLVQLAIASVMFLQPDIRDVVNDVQITSDLDASLLSETGEFRLTGFGARFFGAGVVNCFALLFIVSLLRSSLLGRLRIAYLATALVVIAVVGTLMSRTTLVGLAVAIVYLFAPGTHRRADDQRIWFIGVIGLWCAAVAATLLLASPTWLSDVEPLFDYGFELFLNYLEGEGVSSNSTNELLEMYAQVKDLPFGIGDGYYADPNSPDLYYMGVDIGYVRLIYYFGVPGTLAYFCFQVKAALLASEHVDGSERRWFAVFSIGLLALLNFKGFTDIFFISFLLFACTQGRTAYFTTNPVASTMTPPLLRRAGG